MRTRIVAMLLASGLLAFTLVAAPVYAETGDGSSSGSGDSSNDSSDDNTTTTSNSETESNDDNATKQRKTELRQSLRKEAVTRTQERLSENKLKVCEKHETQINSIMTNRVTQAQNHIDVFSKIYERVKAFYTDKSLSVANYDELTANVDSAKVKAEATLAVLKDSDTFKCDAQDPKAIVTDFKTYHKQLRDDLKAYRTAIKDLIVAVKSAQEGGLN
ncbi:MAG TPA: hypothetical protein VLE73_03540 [Candidatus Saccharimonadales bacterium]|nr:hypothetical protein [Candidatus Saccharimonadales bacterium]